MSEKEQAFFEIDLFLNTILDIVDKINHIPKETGICLVEKLRFYMKEYIILHEKLEKMHKTINFLSNN